MAITASTISSTQTLEEFRLEYNKLRSDVSSLESNPTYGTSITFEGATTDAYETTLTVTDPTADRTITFPNATGTVLLSGSVAISDLDIDGGTDIGAAVVAADLFIVDDGAGGTNRKTTASRLKTFVEASTVAVTGNVTASGTVEPAGDTATGDNAAIGYTSVLGIIVTGQGSTNDITLVNDADTTVLAVPTGTTNVDIVGVATAATFEPDGDTAASDNAAIGYTSAEGLILTGQGSTSDVTIKNDADADVITIATGTTNVTIAGDLTISGDDLTMGTNTSGAALIADGTNFNPVVISGDISINTSGVAAIGAGVIVNADIADDAIDSEHYADGSIDNAHIADDAIDSEHYADGSIDAAHLADNAVTLAKMAGGTDGQIITYDASGDPAAVGPGTDGQVLTSTGAGSPPAFEDASAGGFTEGTEQASTSGDSLTFSSIPTGTKQIYIMIAGLSSNDVDQFGVQIGDSGGIETSGYVGSGAGITDATAASQTSTGRFIMIPTTVAARNYAGTALLTLEDSSDYTWTFMSVTGADAGAAGKYGGGYKALSAELTQLKILTSGPTLDAGVINIMYQ